MHSPQGAARPVRAAVPPDSPLACGWRSVAVALAIEHGLAELLDTLAAYAELAHRQDRIHDPLDCAAPARRRIQQKLYPAEFRRSRGFLGAHGRSAKRIQVVS